METYEYHQILKYLYFEGYVDSYKDAEELVEELTDEEFDSLYEEVFGIDEGYEPLPAQKMKRKIFRKSRIANDANETRKEWENEGGLGNLVQGRRKEVARKASQIKKMKTRLRTHDPLVSQFKELENRAKGKERKKFNEEYYVDEGKVEWDNPNRPLQSGLTPREKNRAKRISLGIEDPHRSSFRGRTFDLTNKDYERYGKLKIAHDTEKDKKVSKNKRHDFGPIFKNSGSGITTTKGQVKRGTGSYKNITNNNEKLYKDDERQKVYHQNNLKEPKESYEMILNHLLDEGYATSLESAEVILENMSEGWKSDVLKSVVKGTKKLAKKASKTKVAKRAKKFVTRTALGAIGIPMIP